jgi:hypothetical protein
MFNGNFWRTLPGMLTATAGIISATTGLVVALNQTGLFRSRTAPAPAPATDVNGAWKAQVTYSWGVSRAERFVFQADKGRLQGTVTFLGAPRGIEAGVVEGDRITFTVRAEELLGSERRPFQLSYTGTAVGGGIHFALEDSRGNPSVQFAAERALPSP